MGYLRLSDCRAAALAIVALTIAYFSSPYIALMRLAGALHRGDVGTVMAAVDWDSVRAGIAQDVADTVSGRDSQPADSLPAFGASFASGIATNAVDTLLTPAAFAASLTPARAPQPAPAHLSWAFFDSPTSFVATLRTPDGEQVKLRMGLMGMRWVVTRAWLPPEILLHHT